MPPAPGAAAGADADGSEGDAVRVSGGPPLDEGASDDGDQPLDQVSDKLLRSMRL